MELRREDLDNAKEIDDGGLSYPLFENARPASRHHKANTPVADLHEGALDMANLEDRSEYRPTATAPFDASINAHVANTLIGDVSHPQLDVAAIPDLKYSPSEHGDLIDYDNEGDYDEEFNYPGTSTGSSTIQGDVLETVADRPGHSINGTTASEHEDEIARLTSLESVSIPVQDDQLILRSFSDGKVGDHSGFLSHTNDGRNWNAATKYRENRENLEAFKRTETSICIRDLQTHNESNDDAGTRYNEGDSILSMSNHNSRQEEDLIHDNTGHEPFTSPVNGGGDTENDQEYPDTSRSPPGNTARTPPRVEDMAHSTKKKRNQNHGISLLSNSNYFSIPQNVSQIQTPRTTEKSQGKTADDDEITYEGDGNDPEPSRTYTFKQNSELTPPLKRTRNDLDDSGIVDCNPKGEDQYFVKF